MIVTCFAPRGTVALRLRKAMSWPEMVVSGPRRIVASTLPLASMNWARTCVVAFCVT